MPSIRERYAVDRPVRPDVSAKVRPGAPETHVRAFSMVHTVVYLDYPDIRVVDYHRAQASDPERRVNTLLAG